MRKTIFAALAAALIAPFAALFPAVPAASAREIVAADLRHLPVADVVILGEVHDDPLHHANQAAAVRALRPRALVFEMLTPGQAVKALGVDHNDAVALERALGWAGTGWPDFAMYAPIFAAAPEARVFGAALPIARVRKAVREGAARAFGPGAAKFGLTTPLPEGEREIREAGQKRDHCDALPERLLPGMVEAQRLRDAALARAVVLAFDQTGGPVAVIAGSGHARRDWGVPVALAHAAPALKVISVGQIEAAPQDVGPDEPFDLWIVTPPIARPDPCAGLRKAG